MTFTTITIDSPWPENGGGKIKRGADRHYTTLQVADIFPTIIDSHTYRPADNAHLYLWVTNNYLPHGLVLMDQLGFRYVNNIPWVKLVDDPERAMLTVLELDMPVPAAMKATTTTGIGQYFRGNHELLLFGVRGKGYEACTTKPDGTRRLDIKGPIFAPLGEHSEKPQAAYDLIESRSRGPYLEMFARKPRPGWTTWGHQ